MDFKNSHIYSISDFLSIIEILRSPRGCVWDRSQTHDSLKSSLIESAYSAVEAIDVNDIDLLRQKLSEILYQLSVHCSIKAEENEFSFSDIVDDISKKLVLSHPHVFNGTYFDRGLKGIPETPKKRDSRMVVTKNNGKRPNDEVKKISKSLPALIRSVKLQEQAAKCGEALFSVEDALKEIFENINFLQKLILEGNSDEYSQNIGKLLFSVSQLARLVSVEPESALYNTCENFKDKILYKISLANKLEV